MLLRVIGVAAALLGLAIPTGADASLKIAGSTTVNPVVVDAAAELRSERGAQIVIDTLGGSSGGLSALADGRAHMAMSSRPISARDRERYPAIDFQPVTIGYDALALVVSRDVWEGGVRSLSADEMRGIYEGRIRNWSELGGPDRRIAFFNKEPGRGTWEVFAKWLYGDSDAAPLVSFLEVGSNEEARQKVAGTRGALSQLSVAWADSETVFALAIRRLAGGLARPERAELDRGDYPLSRALLLVTDGAPSASAETMLDFLLTARGQEIVERHGYLPIRADRLSNVANRSGAGG